LFAAPALAFQVYLNAKADLLMTNGLFHVTRCYSLIANVGEEDLAMELAQ